MARDGKGVSARPICRVVSVRGMLRNYASCRAERPPLNIV